MSSYIGDPPPFGVPHWQRLPIYPVIPGPRTMPVNVPFSNFGLTIVRMDRDGNITIKVDQPEPAE